MRVFVFLMHTNFHSVLYRMCRDDAGMFTVNRDNIGEGQRTDQTKSLLELTLTADMVTVLYLGNSLLVYGTRSACCARVDPYLSASAADRFISHVGLIRKIW